MAAAVEMGEVDDIHSKDDNVTDGVVMNGDLTEEDKMDEANQSNEEDDDKDEAMEIDEQAGQTEEEDSDEKAEEEEEEEEDVAEIETQEVIDANSNDGSVQSVDNDNVDDEDEVHNVDDNSDEDDDEVEVTKDNSDNNSVSDQNGTVVLNDSNEVVDGDGDVVIIDTDTIKANGTASPKDSECTVIDLDQPKPVQQKDSRPPRRSVRNVNKSRKYILETEDATASEESDIEEVLPQDPLAGTDPLSNDKGSSKKSHNSSSTIVVKDTKRLVEIASKSAPSSAGKKEPTLVIIDTNSILSGRGPIPLSQKSSVPNPYNVVALPAQGVYPANMRATITPIPMNNPVSKSTTTPTSTIAAVPVTPSAPILPSLTDDMFVVEAPSFIVPYVYEKPPVKDLKDFIKDVAEEIRKLKAELLKREEEEDETEKENEKDEKDEDEDDDDYKDDDNKDSIKKEKLDGLDLDGGEDKNKRLTYFDSPIGKFFVEIGSGLVEEFVQTDLLKQQKRKREREGGQNSATTKTIQSLLKSLEYTKENNLPYKMSMKKCEFCNYKTESVLAMAFHLETPHMKNFVYRCNFCPYEVRSPHDILFHMEAIHCVRGRLERAPAFHQCPNCPFEDNQKGKLSRHSVACARKFKPERNLEPPIDWEPPAKIPRAPRMKQQTLSTTAAMYQAMAKTSTMQFMKMQQNMAQSALNRGRGRPSLGMSSKQQTSIKPQGAVYKQAVLGGASVLVPTNYQISGNQLYQSTANKNKTVHQPSISITPLPRGAASSNAAALTAPPGAKPGDSNSKNSFVICEICDGYIKDLEQLRNHMQWIHKVKIHPKMIYNRPPLNCQKCQFRFFTDQGLERHLLGSHGLVTSSMQEAANKCKDSGRCPVCGRVYQWKLLNHVARDHNMTLKPAHLSYKCTVCTATFGMYKQFESHVYSAHSVVAKRSIEKKASGGSNSSPGKGESLLKPLKINDEITIIPQMPKSNGSGSSKEGSPSTSSSKSGSSTPGTSKSKSKESKEVLLTGSAIESGEIQIINLG